MKAVYLGILMLCFSLPAYAQGHPTMGGGSTSAVLNGGGGGAAGSVSFPTLMHTPVTRFELAYAHGTDCDFVPSSFMAYDDAVKMGKAILDAQPKTLGEIAAEYRARKKQP